MGRYCRPTGQVPLLGCSRRTATDFFVLARLVSMYLILLGRLLKKSWQPPPQPSVALESYLERTKFEIASITFSNEKDDLSARQREALKTLSANKEINLKKEDKGTTTVIMDTRQKIQEGLEQVSNEDFYKPLETPIVSSTMAKVGKIVKTLFGNGHIDNMTYKWLSSGQKPPRIP